VIQILRRIDMLLIPTINTTNKTSLFYNYWIII